MNVSPSARFTGASGAFRIEIEPDHERVRVAPHGEIDMATAPDVADEVDELVERGFRSIVIDLRPTTFIDSTGVHLLVRQTRRQDATVSVIAGPTSVSRVFDIAGAWDVLRVEPAP